jgi:ACS family hexuronate transporter-like MFS transporter
MAQNWLYSRFNAFLERHMPEGLFPRALIILVAPVVLLQTIPFMTDAGYSRSVAALMITVASVPALLSKPVWGWLIDRIGVKIGAAACVVWWSVAAALTGLARGPLSLAGFRFLLGVGEPGIFPAGMKACGEWFPARLRGTAIGIFSSGSSVGAIIAAPLVVWMTHHWGWRMAFVIPGVVGLVVWLPLWLAVYRHPRATRMDATDAAELERETRPGERRTWRALLRERKVWGLVLGRVGADPVWYLYLFWLPDYLQRVRHLSLVEIGLYAWIPFLFADLGAVFGGVISDRLIKRGWAAPINLELLLGVGFPDWLDQASNWFWLIFKTFVVVSMFIWFRASFPRYRYDQIMRLGWKIFIPVTLVWLVVVAIWMQTPWNIWN